ncbi:MAG: sugar kinase [Spirochaetes bacterium]|nr:sugar kinase [Spirochaetota bacterium]
MRLKSAGYERFFFFFFLEATFGGGEANVAMSLANFGMATKFISALPANPLGDEAVKQLRKFNVDTSCIYRTGRRMGIYFLESGANQRPSKVVYDRAGSAIALACSDDFDFENIFSDVSWFHITGITPALSETAAALTLKAVKAARAKSITVSVDLNYRKKLWKYGKKAPEIMCQVAQFADVLIGNEEDCQKCLDINMPEIDVHSAILTKENYTTLSRAVLKAFPNVRKIAITLRQSHSATHNDWSALLANRETVLFSKKYEMKNIIDRVGGGDSFAAGLIYALSNDQSDREAIEFATAASCLKHSIMGDVNLVSLEEVRTLLKGDGSGRVQR